MIQSICHVVLPHPKESRILLAPETRGWRLPQVSVTLPGLDSWWREAGLINAAAAQQLGCKVTTRYCASVESEGSVPTGVFVLENQDPEWVPPHSGQWAGKQELIGSQFINSAHQALAKDWFGEAIGSHTFSLRPDWEQSGWYRSAAGWIEEQLARLGISITGPVEQMRNWSWSCILRVPTGIGTIYLKAAPPFYGYEPALTQALDLEFPGRVPKVLAIDAKRRWLLMSGTEGVKLNRHPDKERYLPRWEALLQDMARIQRAYMYRIAELQAWGCPDLRPSILAAEIDPLFKKLPQIFEGINPEISVGWLARLQALAPRLKEMCAVLDDCGIPPTLNHGDFHSGNILTNDRECVLLDWAGFIAIAHPFFCLSVVFEEHITPDVRARLREVYLEGWSDIAPAAGLRKAIELALPLGQVYSALLHSRQIQVVANVWDRAVQRENLLYCLRLLLKYFGE